MAFERFQADLLAVLPDLSAELRKAGRFLLDHPDDVALCSMRELAGRSGVTPTTFVRLARRLGFSEWAELRAPFAERLRGGRTSFAARADALASHPAPQDIYAESLAAAAANTAAAADVAQDLAAACEILDRAAWIHVAGFRSCRAPAHAFTYQCRMFRRSVSLLGAEVGALEAELAGLNADEAVLCIGFAPYSRELGAVIAAAGRHGTPLVALADSMAAPFAREAQAVLRFSTASPSFFPSVAAATAISEALAATLLARRGADAAARVRATEAELRAVGAYLPE